MKHLFTIILFAAMVCLQLNANNDKIKALENKCAIIQNQQSHYSHELVLLTRKLKDSDKRIQLLKSENNSQSAAIDSLQDVCKQLGVAQSADRKDINGKFIVTNNNIRENQNKLRNRTLWGISLGVLLLIGMVGVAYRLTKRIKSGTTSIDEVRKAQEALQVAQNKMQEESIKLDDKLLELFNRQITKVPTAIDNGKTDHSLALKVADEIVRIELNMSRMDSSIKGYKQLSKAVERIKDNFKANGYEIVDMLGKPYNEGMKVTANFVTDEGLEEGKQIITGITKPQINYNGQMIQAAQITVSQNI